MGAVYIRSWSFAPNFDIAKCTVGTSVAITFVAGLCMRGVTAPFVLEGAINGPMFLFYVKRRGPTRHHPMVVRSGKAARDRQNIWAAAGCPSAARTRGAIAQVSRERAARLAGQPSTAASVFSSMLLNHGCRPHMDSRLDDLRGRMQVAGKSGAVVSCYA